MFLNKVYYLSEKLVLSLDHMAANVVRAFSAAASTFAQSFALKEQVSRERVKLFSSGFHGTTKDR